MLANKATRNLARRAQWAGMLLLGCASLAMAADKVAQVSEEFLAYLGSLEGDDENWQDFTSDAVTHRAVVAKANASSASSSVSASSVSSSATSQVGKAEK